MNTRLLSRPRRQARGGFSLAELMVVIVIIGLLATLVVPNVVQRLKTAFMGKAKADITALASALDDYATQNGGRYPDSLDVLVTPDENGYTFLKQKSVPVDPWGNEYGYEPPIPGSGQPEPRVYTLGSDGQPGGDGDAADVDNFTIQGGRER
ncbi:MAG: type II secretion system major pseudopilin GspG [Planctomycetes bacterium]|nr:type II secretion system major pseudopilin GspG [Planctomycetota bacterium]